MENFKKNEIKNKIADLETQKRNAQEFADHEAEGKLEQQINELKQQLETAVDQETTTPEFQVNQVNELGGTNEELNEKTQEIDQEIQGVKLSAVEKARKIKEMKAQEILAQEQLVKEQEAQKLQEILAQEQLAKEQEAQKLQNIQATYDQLLSEKAQLESQQTEIQQQIEDQKQIRLEKIKSQKAAIREMHETEETKEMLNDADTKQEIFGDDQDALNEAKRKQKELEEQLKEVQERVEQNKTALQEVYPQTAVGIAAAAEEERIRIEKQQKEKEKEKDKIEKQIDSFKEEEHKTQLLISSLKNELYTSPIVKQKNEEWERVYNNMRFQIDDVRSKMNNLHAHVENPTDLINGYYNKVFQTEILPRLQSKRIFWQSLAETRKNFGLSLPKSIMDHSELFNENKKVIDSISKLISFINNGTNFNDLNFYSQKHLENAKAPNDIDTTILKTINGIKKEFSELFKKETKDLIDQANINKIKTNISQDEKLEIERGLVTVKDIYSCLDSFMSIDPYQTITDKNQMVNLNIIPKNSPQERYVKEYIPLMKQYNFLQDQVEQRKREVLSPITELQVEIRSQENKLLEIQKKRELMEKSLNQK
jgi:hypothetical protein